ncbi:MAG: CCA tRNA nucleotidyltransferase [Acidobacteria bacterium]|nr:MAG: CCA tRNA nucleotidyltransferase [Acidobacteriota bacterium]
MAAIHHITNQTIHPIVLSICRAISRAGGRALMVGGGVRDRLMGVTSKDYDLEVYYLQPDALESLLRQFGPVNTVGARFTVYKLRLQGDQEESLEIDISLPRRESKVGRGHRGFAVTGDPFMSFEEAARRRDFTINAIMYDPLKEEIIDPFHGVQDIERGIIRAVDPRTFGEDSLRVLRAMQFAARFEFRIESNTEELCRSIDLTDLPRERVWGEFEKLFLLARRPSIGLQAALDLLIIDKLLPDLKPMVGCPQDPEWHPEGDVWVHTLMAVDRAVELTEGLPKEKKLTVILAVLLHDIAKPQTTRFERGHLRSPGHEEAAREPTLRVLNALNVHTINGYDVRGQVVALVTNHLKPSQFYGDRHRITDGAFRRLARKCDLELLYLVAKADALARGPASESAAQEWFIQRARALAVEHAPPKPILMGRHLIPLGVPPGPRMGQILKAVYEMQLDGKITTLEEAIRAAQELMRKEAEREAQNGHDEEAPKK